MLFQPCTVIFKNQSCANYCFNTEVLLAMPAFSMNGTINGTINANITANSTWPGGSCTLSPHARALSSVLTAFISSIIGGISGGSHIAFFTTWVSWFGILRILVVGVYQVSCALRLKSIAGSDDFLSFIPFDTAEIRGHNVPFFRGGAEWSSPSFMGWIGWLYTTCYAPVIQVMWLIENWSKADAGLKFVRAISVGVAALPSTIDTKARYGEAFGECCGCIFEVLFTFMTAASTMVLGVVAATELILAVKDGFPWWLFLGYIVFMLFWTYSSFMNQIPYDEGIAVDSVKKFLAGLGTGVFGGCLIAVPAFIVMMMAKNEPGIGLNDYLHCQTVELWQKIAAFLP